MICIRIQSMIAPFIEDQLDMKEMEFFLDHMNSCSKCREELEYYYALLTAMKQLDEDKELSGDFQQELADKLERAQDRLVHVKYTYYRKKAILFVIIIALSFLINIGSLEDNKNDKTSEVSNFKIRKTFRENRDDLLDKQLQDYLKKSGMNIISER